MIFNYVCFIIVSRFAPFWGKGQKISKNDPKNDPKIDAKIQQSRFWVARGAADVDFDCFWSRSGKRDFFMIFESCTKLSKVMKNEHGERQGGGTPPWPDEVSKYARPLAVHI